MDFTAIIVAILAFLGTALGSIVSVISSAKATNQKIDTLKEQVEKHNSIIERVYHLEMTQAVQDEKIISIEQKIKGGSTK